MKFSPSWLDPRARFRIVKPGFLMWNRQNNILESNERLDLFFMLKKNKETLLLSNSNMQIYTGAAPLSMENL